MSDTLPDDAWVNSFLPSPPRPLLSSLQRRLAASTTHVNAIAELYKQRAAIEAQYADSLSKLARAAETGGLNGKGGVEWERSGGEAKLMSSLVSELSETSNSHSTLAATIRSDFEQPTRELPKKIVAWRRIGEQDASLEKTLKDYEKTSAKLQKMSSKANQPKAQQLSSELDQLTSSLSSLSPMVYTTYQRLDEERLRGLKEVIVRWATVRGDMATKDGERSDRAVAALIGWETPEEVLAVGQRLGGGKPTSTPVTTPRSTRRLSSATGTTTDFSPVSAMRQNGSSNNSMTSNTFTGGIKSMLGRTKSTIGSPGIHRDRSASTAQSVMSGRDRQPGFNAIGEEDSRTRTRTPVSAPPASAPPVDEEGFSVAPADRHRNPWEDPNELAPTPAQQPASVSQPPTSNFAQTFSSSPSSSMDNIATNGQRLNLALTSQPIQESEEERQAALHKMQQTLQMPQPLRRQTIARGRRDVRNTMFAGATEDGMSKGPAESPATFTNGDRPGLARGLSGSTNPFDSPGLMSPVGVSELSLRDPGLRASITETISLIMRNGEVQRVQINGEIHLSLRLGSPSQSAGPIHIRLSSFEQLEKIAPNPAYLAQVPDRPGEYFLNSEVLASATQKATAQGTLLFRYQVHVPPGKEMTVVPLILEPAFSCKDGETRMILNYRINPGSRLSPLTDLSFLASFGPGVAVSNVQAKPAGGVWSPSTRRMTWKLDEQAGDGGKIVARFMTEAGEPMTPQGVQASWGVEGSLGSELGVEVVDGQLEGGWRFEEVKKGVIAGKYMAEPTIN